MITLITGAPGTGKSAALVSLISDLSKDRAIYASGIPDLAVPHEVLEDVTSWPETVPDGSLICVDEVQRVWRPRGPGAKVPPDIAALETHRHRGLDFYVITQAPRLMDSNIRGLVGRHVHLRDLGILGRWWYEWPECADNCSTGWKNAPIKKRYKLDKSALAKYTSASVHIKPIRSLPWMLVVLAVALLLVAGLGYKAYKIISSKMGPTPELHQGQVSAGGVDGLAARRAPGPVAVPYDITSFTPRVSSHPESAPAYDTLRVVVAMPKVTAGYCAGDEECKCYTDQGTDAGLSLDECRRFVSNPPFDPYRKRAEPTASRQPGDSEKPAPGRLAPS